MEEQELMEMLIPQTKNRQSKIKMINKAKSLSFERKKNGMGVKLLKRIRKY